jgi:hypothetical protein
LFVVFLEFPIALKLLFLTPETKWDTERYDTQRVEKSLCWKSFSASNLLAQGLMICASFGIDPLPSSPKCRRARNLPSRTGVLAARTVGEENVKYE